MSNASQALCRLQVPVRCAKLCMRVIWLILYCTETGSTYPDQNTAESPGGCTQQSHYVREGAVRASLPGAQQPGLLPCALPLPATGRYWTGGFSPTCSINLIESILRQDGLGTRAAGDVSQSTYIHLFKSSCYSSISQTQKLSVVLVCLCCSHFGAKRCSS